MSLSLWCRMELEWNRFAWCCCCCCCCCYVQEARSFSRVNKRMRMFSRESFASMQANDVCVCVYKCHWGFWMCALFFILCPKLVWTVNVSWHRFLCADSQFFSSLLGSIRQMVTYGCWMKYFTIRIVKTTCNCSAQILLCSTGFWTFFYFFVIVVVVVVIVSYLNGCCHSQYMLKYNWTNLVLVLYTALQLHRALFISPRWIRCSKHQMMSYIALGNKILCFVGRSVAHWIYSDCT